MPDFLLVLHLQQRDLFFIVIIVIVAAFVVVVFVFVAALLLLEGGATVVSATGVLFGLSPLLFVVIVADALRERPERVVVEKVQLVHADHDLGGGVEQSLNAFDVEFRFVSCCE